MKDIIKILFLILITTVFLSSCNQEPNAPKKVAEYSGIFLKGTETLGDPEIPLVNGSGFVTAGTGLINQPGIIDLSVIPTGSEVNQVLLYWSGGFDADSSANGDSTLNVNGVEITGETIGGTTLFYLSAADEPVTFESFRADITNDFDWTAINSLTISGMDNGDLLGPQVYNENDGAGVFIIYDDGTTTDIQLLDGQDLAFKGFGGQLQSTVPQTFNFAPSSIDRAASLGFFAGSVAADRANVTRVTMNGNTNDYFELFGSADGADWDSPILPIVIPAGTESIAVELISDEHGTSLLPASLLWVIAALSIDEPVIELGCTRTQGYWKNHSYYGPAPYDSTWENLLNDPYNDLGDYQDFFLSNKNYHKILRTAVKGNAYYILAHQYIAAILNEYAGAEIPEEVGNKINEATDLFNTYTPDEIKLLKGNNPLRQQFIDLGEYLDDYNNGYLGLPHCDEEYEVFKAVKSK